MIDMILLLMIITISLNSYYYSEILNLTLMMYIKIQYFMVKIGEWVIKLYSNKIETSPNILNLHLHVRRYPTSKWY